MSHSSIETEWYPGSIDEFETLLIILKISPVIPQFIFWPHIVLIRTVFIVGIVVGIAIFIAELSSTTIASCSRRAFRVQVLAVFKCLETRKLVDLDVIVFITFSDEAITVHCLAFIVENVFALLTGAVILEEVFVSLTCVA